MDTEVAAAVSAVRHNADFLADVITHLEQENAALRGELARLVSIATRPAHAFPEGVRRRGYLRAAAVAEGITAPSPDTVGITDARCSEARRRLRRPVSQLPRWASQREVEAFLDAYNLREPGQHNPDRIANGITAVLNLT